MKKIIAICLLCALCAGTAMARNLVIKKDNQIVAMYSEDQFDEVVFETDKMELTKDIESLLITYVRPVIELKVKETSGKWTRYKKEMGDEYTFYCTGDEGLLTLVLPAFEIRGYSIPEMKFEGMDVYASTMPGGPGSAIMNFPEPQQVKCRAPTKNSQPR